MASTAPIDLEGWALKSLLQAMGREIPELRGKLASAPVSEVQQRFFRLFRFLRFRVAPGRVLHAAYRSDNSSILVLSGRQERFRLLASIDPATFRSAEDVVAFLSFADEVVAAEHEPPAAPIASVDDVAALPDALRELLRPRVQPPEQMVQSFGLQERFHFVSDGKLIERVRTVASGGIYWRQDEILADPLG